MRRADRLFTILQLLRGGRYVTAHALAARLEVSERTIYRDVDELTLCGVPIEGHAGRGLRLPKNFEIPPLMFARNEIQALVAGARFVEAWCGPELAGSAQSALARIRAVLPAELLAEVDDARVFAPRFGRRTTTKNFEIVHRALSEKRRLGFAYAAQTGSPSRRTVRPLGLYFWGKVWTLTAWCEMRDDFRNFRVDRIVDLSPGDVFDDEPNKTLELFLHRMRA